jgi:hypothetical protein
MTNIALNQNARLTDALERELLNRAIDEHIRPQPAKHAFRALGAGISGFFGFVDEVGSLMATARRAARFYPGSNW